MVPVKGRDPSFMMGCPVSNHGHLQHLKNKISCRSFQERSAQFNLLFLIEEKNAPPKVKGGLAQLVERLLCKQNVNGSNPLTSTTFQVIASRVCRQRLLLIVWKTNGPVAQLVRAHA